jgi:hypothetical protein
MLRMPITRKSPLREFLSPEPREFALIRTRSAEEKVRLLILRDLFRLGWQMDVKPNEVLIEPPSSYDKQVVRDSMQVKREELLKENSAWIAKHIELARRNLGQGTRVWHSNIEPIVEVCESQEQLDTFRIFRFYWSSPYSEYVGRRIKLLIRDAGLARQPIIGIAAIGSSIIHIPERDEWIGWDKETRTQNLVYTMDAYVLGALPPYNYLLGGKLVSYLIASNEVRQVFCSKYKDAVTNIFGRKANRLACLFTTSLYGKSSQYNRIKYDKDLLYVPVGRTKGYGTLHLTNETFTAMRDLLASRGISVANRFGDGPIWRMRVIRTAGDILGFNADFLLRHSFQRQIYAVPLAHNFKAFLRGEHSRLRQRDYPLGDLVQHWKDRWLSIRKSNPQVASAVHSYHPSSFTVSPDCGVIS